MGVKAVHFDDSTIAVLLGHAPDNSPYFFSSFWYRFESNAGVFVISSVLQPYPDSGTGIAVINQNTGDYSDDQGNPLSGLHLALQFSVGRTSLDFGQEYFLMASPPLPDDGVWHHVMVFVRSDGGGDPSGEYAIDNVVHKLFVNGHSGNNGTIVHSLTSYWGIYGAGDIAEVFVLTSENIDITDPAVRARFIDPDTLRPVPIDAGGLYPFFDSLGVVPQIWLSGNPDLFPRNYPGWSATCVSQTDSDPTSQFEVIGNLTTADSDPFGQDGSGLIS